MSDFIQNGEKIIQGLIAQAKQQGKTNVVISGNYMINDTIIIPSDTTLVLQDCHLRLADNTFCNIFRNAVCYDTENRTTQNADKNIKIIGIGKAILDGGNYNGLSERNCCKEGRPHIYVNNILLFSNVEGIEIRDIKITNQRYWALNFIYCRYAYIGNIEFIGDYQRYDENHNLVKGLIKGPNDCCMTQIVNADGIDLRVGCHDFTIENIRGFTEDDTVALTALPSDNELRFSVENESVDIYNITIRNIVTSCFCASVRLLNQGGARLYNVLIDGVRDASLDTRYYVGRGSATIRIGDEHMYGTRHSYKDETFNVIIRNVFTRAGKGLALAGEMTNVVYENVFGFDNCPLLVDDEKAKIYKK